MCEMDDSGIGVIGAGHYLPLNIQTNQDLCEHISSLTSEWILEKTGIKRRYHVSEGETCTSMAFNAVERALAITGIDKDEIGLVIVASFSQDYLFPPMSAKIHQLLKLPKECQIIDLNTNCVGIVTAITVASERMMNDNSIKYSLVIGAELLSKYTDKLDVNTSIFFSDGATAIVLGKVENGFGFKSAKFRTDSSTFESVRMRGGGSSFPISEKESDEKAFYIEQNGLATWKQAITNLPLTIKQLIDHEGLTSDDIDFIIFHQANGFLIDYISKKMKIPADKTYTNVEEIGNTGSASIGIALSEALEKKLIKKGDNLILAGVGAGFNFGACLIKM